MNNIVGNILLSQLPFEAKEAILSRSHEVFIHESDCWEPKNDGKLWTLFPETGLLSQNVSVGSGSIEVAKIGREGFLDYALDTYRSPTTRTVAIASSKGLAILSSEFSELQILFPAVAELRNRFLSVAMKQLEHTIGCQAFHSIELRVSNWLMSAITLSSNEMIRLTQEDLARFLGCGRPGVNLALNALKKRRLIDIGRKHVHVLDLDGLRKYSCGCHMHYGKHYSDIMQFGLAPHSRVSGLLDEPEFVIAS